VPSGQIATNKKPMAFVNGTAVTMAKTAAAPPTASSNGGGVGPTTKTGHVTPLSFISIVITKPTRDTKLGIVVRQQTSTSKTIITQINSDSILFDTNLRVGMLLETINGRKCSSFKECIAMMKSAVGQMVFVVSVPTAPGSATALGFNVAVAEKKKSATVTALSAAESASVEPAVASAATIEGVAAASMTAKPIHATFSGTVKSAASSTYIPMAIVASASLPAPKPTTVTASSSSTGSGGKTAESQKAVTIVVAKPTKEIKLGLSIEFMGKDIVVTQIQPNSIFWHTKLRTNMRIVTVNGASYATFQEGIDLLKNAEGTVTIAAAALSASAHTVREPPSKKTKTG